MQSPNPAAPTVGLAQQLLFGAAGETSVHPAIAVAVAVGIVMMMTMRRKYVVLPLILLSIMIPLGQRIVIGPIHLPIFRLLALFAFMRLVWQRYVGEGKSFNIRFNVIDTALILFAISTVVNYTLLWQSVGALIGQLGKAYNGVFYFVFRFFIRDREDVERVIKLMAVIALAVAAFMINEQITGRNLLAVFGGVREYTTVRAGYRRAQGPFEIYLTAGAFGATLIPLFLCLWHKPGARMMAALGVVAAISIAITSRTSTATSAIFAAFIGVAMWVFRDSMRLVRWGIVSALVTLHLVMKAPVWALLARIDLVGGSTGWHRFKIVDNCIRHFWDWCLIGSNNYWNWDGGDDMWDMANQYVAIANTSGLLPLVCYLATIVYSFKYLGNARKAAKDDGQLAWFLWLLGVALFSNLVAFLGISYFDQTFISWYTLLAIIVAMTVSSRKPVAHQTASTPIISESFFEVRAWQTEPGWFEPIREGRGEVQPVAEKLLTRDAGPSGRQFPSDYNENAIH